MKAFPILHARNSNGKINKWAIGVQDDGKVVIWEGIINSGLTRTERQSKGKNVGKMNETTPYQQALKDAESRWNDKKKKGYKSLEDLDIKDPTLSDSLLEQAIDLALPMVRTDANNLNKPMKCQPYFKDNGEVRIAFPCYGQPKFNGFRVMSRLEEGLVGEGLFSKDAVKPTFRSKEGLMYTTLEHIEPEVDILIHNLAAEIDIPAKDIILDGEMYIHGIKLQDIASAVKKKNSNTSKLKFCIFDIAIKVATQNKRLQYLNVLQKIVTQHQLTNIYNVVTIFVVDDNEAQKLTDEWIAGGYEGGVFRDPKAHYQFGSRPRTMVKLKRCLDEDFEIIDIIGGENAPDQGILVCRTKKGVVFKANPDATHEVRREYLINKSNYIGKKAQIKFHEWTKEEKPFHIKEVVIRDYE